MKNSQTKQMQILGHSERFAQRCQELLKTSSPAGGEILPFVPNHTLQTKIPPSSAFFHGEAEAVAQSGSSRAPVSLCGKGIMARLRRFF